LLGEAEIEHLGVALGGQHDVGRFEIAVDDAVVVGGAEGFGDLGRGRHHFFE
jgi:hypothetical protein